MFQYKDFTLGFENVFDKVSETSATRKYPYLQESKACFAWNSSFGKYYTRINCFAGDIMVGGSGKVSD